MLLRSTGEQTSRLRKRLESSLLHLHRSLRIDRPHGHQNGNQDGPGTDSAYAEWQSRWASRRSEIVRRLEAIDSQLDRLMPTGDRGLRLAIIDTAPERRAACETVEA